MGRAERPQFAAAEAEKLLPARQNENRSAICNCREKFACEVIVPKELLPNDTFGP